MTKRVNPLGISVSQDSEGCKLYTLYESIQPPMTNHPITPPPVLVKQWLTEPEYVSGWNGKCTMISVTDHRLSNICAKAARWGADQQLAEDAKWLDQHALDAPHLKITPAGESLIEAMRPKSPSLKEQALKGFYTISQFVLDEWSGCSDYKVYKEITDTVLRALEALDE